MTTDMFHNFKRLACFFVYKRVFCFCRDLVSEFKDDITCVSHILRNIELSARCFVKIFSCFFEFFRKMLPGLNYLGINSKRGYTRNCDILITRFLHQRKVPGYYGHDGSKWHDIPMISYPGACCVRRILINIFAKTLSHDVEKKLFRSGEEALTDTRPDVEEMVICYLFLVFGPDPFFT